MILSGKAVAAQKDIDLPGVLCDKYGNKLQPVNLTEVGFTPDSNFNLCSITRLLVDVWQLKGNIDALSVSKGGVTITFDIVIRTRKGALFCTYIKRNNKVSGRAVDKEKAVSVAKAHALLGHSHEDAT